jgi:hypothetical protein
MTNLYIAREFLPSVREGRKTSTIRKGIRQLDLGPAVLTSGGESATVRITRVSHTSLALLTEDDAKRDGFKTLAELNAALKRFYPTIDSLAPVTIISFRVVR